MTDTCNIEGCETPISPKNRSGKCKRHRNRDVWRKRRVEYLALHPQHGGPPRKEYPKMHDEGIPARSGKSESNTTSRSAVVEPGAKAQRIEGKAEPACKVCGWLGEHPGGVCSMCRGFQAEAAHWRTRHPSAQTATIRSISGSGRFFGEIGNTNLVGSK
jgi:hypothetical protein